VFTGKSATPTNPYPGEAACTRRRHPLDTLIAEYREKPVTGGERQNVVEEFAREAILGQGGMVDRVGRLRQTADAGGLGAAYPYTGPMTTTTSPVTEKTHRNHGLFSDHYLDATLPERPGWKEMAEEARAVMEEIARVFDSYAPSDNEAQTERDLVPYSLHLAKPV